MTISEYEDGPWDDDEWDEWDDDEWDEWEDDADFYADENLLALDWIGDVDLLPPSRPARFYECRECDGMGRDLYYNECEKCRGTGARWGWLGWLRVLRGFITPRVYHCLCGKIDTLRVFGKLINIKHVHKRGCDEIPF